MDASARLRAEWLANVEAPLGSHVHPLSYDGGHLRLGAETAAWASRARMQQAKLLNELRRRPFFRGLRSVKVQVRPPGATAPGPTRADPGLATEARSASRLSPYVASLVRDVAAGVDDAELRAALERLAGRAARVPTRTK